MSLVRLMKEILNMKPHYIQSFSHEITPLKRVSIDI